MIITHQELHDLLTKKDKLVNEGRELSKQIEDLETERNKLALQIQKVKDKVIPIVQKEMEGKLGEYEEISEVKTTEDGQVDIAIYDQVEQFKEYLKEKKDADSGNTPSEEPPATEEPATDTEATA